MTDQCKEFCQKLSDYLDGLLEENVCVLIEQHLEVCPPCGLMYESLRTAVEICRKGVTDDIPEEMARELKTYLRAHCRGSDH
jgi:predicted anti-sigma-YlaC factor YlaD